MEKGYLDEMSPKLKMALLSLVDDYYKIEKQHTVVVMPFFGLLHSQGNESKPFMNFVDINILNLMNKQFKDVIVYPGENNYLSSYGLDLTSVEHLAHEQYLLSSIVNETTNFNELSDRHKKILSLYEKAISDFATMRNEYPLPYRTAFDIHSPEELIDFVKQLDIKIKQENKHNKICLLCPISYLIEKPHQLYDSLIETINSIDGTLYFTQNQSDVYLIKNYYQMLYNEQYSETFIQSIQDFANVYNKEITQKAKSKLNFDDIIHAIKNGYYGTTENEVINNIEQQIDIEKIYYSTPSISEDTLIK